MNFLLFVFLFSLSPEAKKRTFLNFTKAKSKKECSESGVEVFPDKTYFLSLRNSFGKKNFLSEISKIPIEYALRAKPSQCPANCKRKNNFRSFITIKQTRVTANSCPLKESKEKYEFKKMFKTKLNKNQKQSMIKTGNKMNQWILNTFVYPYLPIRFGNPSEEYKKITKDACPSCSFHIAYDYTYEQNNQIDMNMKVSCTDIKKPLFSKQEATLVVKNYWKCFK